MSRPTFVAPVVVGSASIAPTVIKPPTVVEPPTVVKPPAITAVVVKTRVVKTSAVEISPVVSFEDRTIVFEVYAIPEVTVPGGIIIVDISGIVGFTDFRVGIITAVAVIGG